jgi:hypothetical protein
MPQRKPLPLPRIGSADTQEAFVTAPRVHPNQVQIDVLSGRRSSSRYATRPVRLKRKWFG